MDGKPTFQSVLGSDIKAATGVEYSISVCRYMLHEAGWSPKVPMPVHVNQAAIDEVINWQKSTNAWRSCLIRDGFLLYVMDQTTIVLDFTNKRGPWSKIGERIHAPYFGNHKRVMVWGDLLARQAAVHGHAPIPHGRGGGVSGAFDSAAQDRAHHGQIFSTHIERSAGSDCRQPSQTARQRISYGLARTERNRALLEHLEVVTVHSCALWINRR